MHDKNHAPVDSRVFVGGHIGRFGTVVGQISDHWRLVQLSDPARKEPSRFHVDLLQVVGELPKLCMAMQSDEDQIWEYYPHTKLPDGPDHICENCGPLQEGVPVYGTNNYVDKECTNLLGDSAMSICEPCLVDQIIGTYRDHIWNDEAKVYWYVVS